MQWEKEQSTSTWEIVNDADVNPRRELELVLENWRQYFSTLLNISYEARVQQDNSIIGSSEPEPEHTSRNQVFITKAPMNKALRCEGIPDELVRYAKKVGIAWFHKLYNLKKSSAGLKKCFNYFSLEGEKQKGLQQA